MVRRTVLCFLTFSFETRPSPPGQTLGVTRETRPSRPVKCTCEIRTSNDPSCRIQLVNFFKKSTVNLLGHSSSNVLWTYQECWQDSPSTIIRIKYLLFACILGSRILIICRINPKFDSRYKNVSDTRKRRGTYTHTHTNIHISIYVCVYVYTHENSIYISTRITRI